MNLEIEMANLSNAQQTALSNLQVKASMMGQELTNEQLTELFAIQRQLLTKNVFVSNEVMSELILDEHNFVINTEAN